MDILSFRIAIWIFKILDKRGKQMNIIRRLIWLIFGIIMMMLWWLLFPIGLLVILISEGSLGNFTVKENLEAYMGVTIDLLKGEEQ